MFKKTQILNLFVAIIIDNFDYMTRDKSILGAYDLKQFVNQWSSADQQARFTLATPPYLCIYKNPLNAQLEVIKLLTNAKINISNPNLFPCPLNYHEIHALVSL